MHASDAQSVIKAAAFLGSLVDLLQAASAISTPAARDGEADSPIETQRLLSPTSEHKVATVMSWSALPTSDPALARLSSDASQLSRDKVNAVNRMRNTIIYAERVRQEWEIRANQSLPPVTEEAQTPIVGSNNDQDVDAPQADLAGLGFGGFAPCFGDDDTSAARDFAASPDQSGAGGLVMDDDLTVEMPNLSRLSLVTVPPAHSAFPSPNLSRSASPAPASPVIGLAHTDGRSLSVTTSPLMSGGPLSPRIPSSVPTTSKPKSSSIKDFDIIKPISKGAFGSVYLAKKKTTGDYYAIKTLKKSDMIAKNQVTNVKAERLIMMNQADSDFVVKLFYTFQSRDYLYLVMEYLNGGDCAALIKALGSLEEDWVRNYVAEVVLGLDHLHTRGVVHR